MTNPMDAERVDELLSRLPPPAPLTPAQVARIRANIDAGPRPVFARSFRLAGAIGLLLLCTVALARYLIDRDEPASVGAPTADAQVASPPVPLPVAPSPPGPQPVVTADVPDQAPVPIKPVTRPRTIAKPHDQTHLPSSSNRRLRCSRRCSRRRARSLRIAPAWNCAPPAPPATQSNECSRDPRSVRRAVSARRARGRGACGPYRGLACVG